MKYNLAIVTGGTRGIGAATSIMLRENGYEVIANYNSNDTAAAEFSKKTGIKTKKWNVSDFKACKVAIEQIEKEHGNISILVNNAGIAADNMLHKSNNDDWHKVIHTNLTSCFNMCHAVIGKMREQKFGRIVLLSSINALAGQLGQTNYCASKAGMIGFAKALARESAIKNVTVNVVAPGYIETDMTTTMPEHILESIRVQIPVGRLGKPEEIAQSILFLVDKNSGFITGEVLSVNGGHYMA